MNTSSKARNESLCSFLLLGDYFTFWTSMLSRAFAKALQLTLQRLAPRHQLCGQSLESKEVMCMASTAKNQRLTLPKSSKECGFSCVYMFFEALRCFFDLFWSWFIRPGATSSVPKPQPIASAMSWGLHCGRSTRCLTFLASWINFEALRPYEISFVSQRKDL